MDSIQLKDFITAVVPEAEILEGKQYTEVKVPAKEYKNLAQLLRNDKNADFDFLFCMTGVDYGDNLGIVCHLRSTTQNHTVVLKVQTSNRENPEIDSVCSIWKTAEFLEREIFDLLGIKFTGHPDLRRLFLDDNYGFPLRKDFVDEVNIVTK